MKKFEKSLAAIDGTKEWSDIRPLFDDVFHPDCVFVTADGDFSKEQWAEMAKGLVAKGVVSKEEARNKAANPDTFM